MQTRKRCWLTHNRREDWGGCPLCYTTLKWVFTGIVWVPCNAEPVLYIEGEGKVPIVKQREIISDCKIYKMGDDASKAKYGLLPHVFSCEEL